MSIFSGLGVTDRFGTSVSEYRLLFDPGFFKLQSNIAATMANMGYTILVLPAAVVGGWAVSIASDPVRLFQPVEDAYLKLSGPILDKIPTLQLVALSCAIILVVASFTPRRTMATLGQETKRLAAAVVIGGLIAGLAKNPFFILHTVLGWVTDILNDLVYGSNASGLGGVADSYIMPITHIINYGGELTPACQQEWSQAMASGGTPACAPPISDVSFSVLSTIVVAFPTSLLVSAFGIFSLAILLWHLVLSCLGFTLIPWAGIVSIAKDRRFETLTRMAAKAFAHMVIVCIITTICILGMALVSGIASAIASSDIAGSATSAVSLIFMDIGYIGLMLSIFWLTRSTGKIAKALHIGSGDGGATGIAPLDSQINKAQTRSSALMAAGKDKIKGVVMDKIGSHFGLSSTKEKGGRVGTRGTEKAAQQDVITRTPAPTSQPSAPLGSGATVGSVSLPNPKSVQSALAVSSIAAPLAGKAIGSMKSKKAAGVGTQEVAKGMAPITPNVSKGGVGKNATSEKNGGEESSTSPADSSSMSSKGAHAAQSTDTGMDDRKDDQNTLSNDSRSTTSPSSQRQSEVKPVEAISTNSIVPGRGANVPPVSKSGTYGAATVGAAPTPSADVEPIMVSDAAMGGVEPSTTNMDAPNTAETKSKTKTYRMNDMFTPSRETSAPGSPQRFADSFKSSTANTSTKPYSFGMPDVPVKESFIATSLTDPTVVGGFKSHITEARIISSMESGSMLTPANVDADDIRTQLRFTTNDMGENVIEPYFATSLSGFRG